MSIQKFAKFAKHLDLCILHDDNTSLTFVDAAKLIFRNVLLKTFDQSTSKGINSHLLIICGSSESIRSTAAKTSIAALQRLETVILTHDFSNVAMLRMALAIRAMHVANVPENEEIFVQEMVKILPTLNKKIQRFDS